MLQRAVPGLRDDPAVLDTRPILVVEFDPQHVFEEALFRPSGPKLPDVALPDDTFVVDWKQAAEKKLVAGDVSSLPTQFSTAASRLLKQLAPLKPQERLFVRGEYAERKISVDAKPFAAFSKEFKTRFDKVKERLRLPL